MLVALAVVPQGPVLDALLGLRQADAHRSVRGVGRGRRHRQLERVERGARVPAGHAHEVPDRLVRHLGAGGAQAALPVGERVAQDAGDVRVLERPELEDAAAREQRGVDVEEGVLGRRADQDHRAVLDVRQQRVLLRAVEAVDLVDEEDRALVRDLAAPLRAGDDLADVGDARPSPR